MMAKFDTKCNNAKEKIFLFFILENL